jgi:hypothetical protein
MDPDNFLLNDVILFENINTPSLRPIHKKFCPIKLFLTILTTCYTIQHFFMMTERFVTQKQTPQFLLKILSAMYRCRKINVFQVGGLVGTNLRNLEKIK